MTLLTGSQISLREFQYDDWADINAYMSQEVVYRYQAWGPLTEEQMQTYAGIIINDSRINPRPRFAFAILDNRTENVIGMGEVHIRSVQDRQGEIGYHLHPDYWGKGMATEAAKLLVKFGFNELQLHRIYATCDPRNVGSSRVLTKAGMTLEGRMRDTLLIQDGWRDSLMYSILEDEHQ